MPAIIKTALFGLTHGLIVLASTLTVIFMSIFLLAKPVSEAIFSAGFDQRLAYFAATVCMLSAVILFAWRILYPYTTWLEKELQKRHAFTGGARS